MCKLMQEDAGKTQEFLLQSIAFLDLGLLVASNTIDDIANSLVQDSDAPSSTAPPSSSATTTNSQPSSSATSTGSSSQPASSSSSSQPTSTSQPPSSTSEPPSTTQAPPPSTTSAPLPTTTTSNPPPPTSTSAPPPAQAKCNTGYKVFWDSFDIYGINWDQKKLDGDGALNSGDGLHHQLSGCSKVSKWKFEQLTPGPDQPYSFHASGRTTIWQKNCIEHAIGSAGSPNQDCSGSG